MTQPEKKIALVTGANKGIGFEVARQLGAAGYLVLLGARSMQNGDAAAAKLTAAGVDAHSLELDLERAETITAAAAWIDSQFGRLDVLVNNAGIASPGDGPPSAVVLSAVEQTFKVNFLGALAVSQAMLPLLRRSAAGRIVNVSSGLGSLTQNGDANWGFAAVKFLGYNSSKAALNMLTVQLAFELRETGIKVNSADPGFTATDLNNHRGTQTVEQGAAETVRLAMLPDDGPTGTYSRNEGIVPW